MQKKIGNKRQEAILCDGCNKWQHRTCRSGVSREMYRNAVKSGEDIPWRCKPCSTLHEFFLKMCLFTYNCCSVIFLSTALSPNKSNRAQAGNRSNCGILISRTKSRSPPQSKAVISRNLTGNTVKYDSSADCRE